MNGFVIPTMILIVGIVGWIISQAGASKRERPQLGAGSSTGSAGGPPPICKTCGSYGYWLVPYSVVACSRCNNASTKPAYGFAPAVPPPMQQPLAPPVGPPVPPAAVVQPGHEIVGVQMPGAPFCPTCSAPTVWVANASAFGCQRCQKMV